MSRACRYDPDLNPTYQEFAMHYDVGVVPARPRHPKDKAKVEVNPTYQEFAMHYDVGVVPARPRHPKDKAKVEVGVQIVRR